MKFDLFQFRVWTDVVYLIPTIMVIYDDPILNNRNFSIEFHFLVWNMRWRWIEES